MKYTVHSQMMAELTPSPPQMARNPVHMVIRRIWRGVGWLLLPFCYLGALFAPALVLGMIVEAFQRDDVSSAARWIIYVFIGGLIVWKICSAAICFKRNLQQHVIHIESIVLFLALLLAVFTIGSVIQPQ